MTKSVFLLALIRLLLRTGLSEDTIFNLVDIFFKMMRIHTQLSKYPHDDSIYNEITPLD